MEQKNVEIWRPVVGYENSYAVSSLGRVKSVERTCKHWRGGVRRIKEQILKPQPSSKEGDQHLHVTLHKNGVAKTWGIHRLVAFAFPEICGEYFEGADVNHIDENPLNNTPENLNWMTRKENNNHGTHNERIAKALSKTVYQYTKNYELVGEYSSIKEVYRQTGWNRHHISECCLGKRKTANGYVWSYTRF